MDGKPSQPREPRQRTSELWLWLGAGVACFALGWLCARTYYTGWRPMLSLSGFGSQPVRRPVGLGELHAPVVKRKAVI